MPLSNLLSIIWCKIIIFYIKAFLSPSSVSTFVFLLQHFWSRERGARTCIYVSMIQNINTISALGQEPDVLTEARVLCFSAFMDFCPAPWNQFSRTFSQALLLQWQPSKDCCKVLNSECLALISCLSLQIAIKLSHSNNSVIVAAIILIQLSREMHVFPCELLPLPVWSLASARNQLKPGVTIHRWYGDLMKVFAMLLLL